MLLAGTVAGVLAAVAVTVLSAVAGDGPGVVVAALTASGLAVIPALRPTVDPTLTSTPGWHEAAGAGSWQCSVTALTRSGAVVLVVFAVVLAVMRTVAGDDRAQVSTTVAAVLALIPAATVPLVLFVEVITGSAARMAAAGVSAGAIGLEEAGRVTLLVSEKDGILTAGGGSVSQLWAVNDDLAGLATALVLCAGDPPVAADAPVFALARSLSLDPGRIVAELPRVAEVPYDADRRRMSTASRSGDGFLIVCQGAPEELWPLLVTSADGATAATGLAGPLARRWSAAGLRVTAVATATRRVAGNAAGRLEWGLRLHGLVGFDDAPMVGARDAVTDLAGLGVEVAMVTGDHLATALAAALGVGIVSDTRGAPAATGQDVAAGRWAPDIRVFARIGPEQRARLVSQWQAAGEVVAVAGRDPGDAAALGRADLAIALGAGAAPEVSGPADVHTATADLRSVVAVVRESRRIHGMLRRGSTVLAVTVLAATGLVVGGAARGGDPGLTPAAVLLLTWWAAPLAVACAWEPPESGAMGRPLPGGGGVFVAAWWGRVLTLAAVAVLVVVLLVSLAVLVVGWSSVTWQRPLPAATFAALSLTLLGVAAVDRGGPLFGRGHGRVTGWLVTASCGLVLVFLSPLSWLLGGQYS